MNTIIAIGGSGPHSVVIGGRANYKNADIRDKWNAHKQFGNPKFMIKTVNEIMLLPEYIEDEKLLAEVLMVIWNSPIEKIYNSIIRSSELDEPLIIARRTMFWKLKELIESIILLHIKIVHKLDIQQLMASWTDKIKKNKIDTSSIILWSLFSQVNKPELFRNIDFKYLGYCPNASSIRIQELLKFPADKLIDEIKNADPAIDLSALKFDELDKLLIKKIGPMPIPTGLATIGKPLITQCEVSSFIEAWLDLNDKLKPFLEESESYFIDIAKQMESLSSELEKINKQLLLQIKSSS